MTDVRKAKAGRQAAVARRREACAASMNALVAVERIPPRYAPLVGRVREGRLAAAVKLKCLDCSAYSQEEVRRCAVVACPLYGVRPYR